MKNISRKLLAILLSLTLVLCFAPAAYAGGPVTYIDAAGQTQQVDNVTTITGDTATLTDGWYIVSDTVARGSRLTVSATGEGAHLILADNCTYTVTGGIFLSGQNKLTVYAQSTGDSMGSLTAIGAERTAGIGGIQEGGADDYYFKNYRACGILTICGGNITANGGTSGAGIGSSGGGGADVPGGTVTVYGGKVNATGGIYGAGIGGGDGAVGGTLTVYGGTVTAAGGTSTKVQGAGSGAGIGGGGGYGPYYRDGGVVTVYGGTVTATGGTANADNSGSGAGIGGGGCGTNDNNNQILPGKGGITTIYGGTVITNAGGFTTSNGTAGHGIGGGGSHKVGVGSGGTTVIAGGSVKTSNIGDPQPTNGNSTNVYLNTLTVGESPIVSASITSGSIDGIICAEVSSAEAGVYGIKDVKTDGSGNVYFWLPATAENKHVRLTANSAHYTSDYTREANNSNTATLNQISGPTVVSLSATQTGGTPDTKDSTGVTLTFGTNVTDITTDNIVLISASGLATKDGLSGNNTEYSLGLASVGIQGDIIVNIGDFGDYVFLNSQTVTAYRDSTPPTQGDSGTVTTASVVSNSLSLNWTKASDAGTQESALKYFVYRSDSNNIGSVSDCGSNGTLLNNDGTSDINTYDVLDLSPYTSYYFNVVVADANGNRSAYTTVNATTEKAELAGTVTISGTPTYGETLTAMTSGLTSNPTVDEGAFSYQWKRGEVEITDATNAVYTLTSSDVGQQISVTVTAANCTGEKTSAVTNTVTQKPLTFAGTVTATKEYDGNANFSDTHITVTNAGNFGSGIVDDDEVQLDKTNVTGTFGPGVGNGNLALTKDFSLTGDDAGNYALSAQPTVTANITQAVPQTITWPTATTITYGAKLSTSQLDGGSGDGGGDFAWTDGTITPTVENSGYSVTFTPSDTSNYNYTGVTLTHNTAITVNPAAGSFGAPSAINTTYTSGLTLADLNGQLASGYAWIAPGTALAAGDGQTFAAIYTHPSGNYTSASGNITVNVAKDEDGDGGSVIVPPGSQVEEEGDNIKVTLPDGGGSVVVPPGSQVEEEGDNIKVTLPGGGGSVIVSPGSTVMSGENEGEIKVTLPGDGGSVIVPPGSTVDAEGNVTAPPTPPATENGWVKNEDGEWEYLTDGKAQTGWLYDTGYTAWFYLGTDGEMQTGWVYDQKDKAWYYLAGNGKMVVGKWLHDTDGNWYYLSGNGKMVTGKQNIGGKTYSFRGNGVWIG